MVVDAGNTATFYPFPQLPATPEISLEAFELLGFIQALDYWCLSLLGYLFSSCPSKLILQGRQSRLPMREEKHVTCVL